MPDVRLVVHPDLRFLLPARRRAAEIEVRHDGTSSAGHLVQSVGVPLTEVGRLVVGGTEVSVSYRPSAADRIEVHPVDRPQRPPAQRFLLDVHLGSLARRMRLLGLDTSYVPDADDDTLVRAALTEDRVLLTRDRGLLFRRAVTGRAAYVRGDHADDQLADVLERFAPALYPYVRCLLCNGIVHAVDKSEVVGQLQPGTARTYDDFGRCEQCHRVYWRGAHGRRLAAVVRAAEVRTGDA